MSIPTIIASGLLLGTEVALNADVGLMRAWIAALLAMVSALQHLR